MFEMNKLGQIKHLEEKCKYEFWKDQVDKVCILMVDKNFEVYRLGNVVEKSLAKCMF